MTTRPFAVDLTTARDDSSMGHNRRQEARVEDCHECEYEVCEFGAQGMVAIVQGRLYTLNRSAHGMLLIMAEAPCLNQLIGVHNPKLGWHRSTMVYHVRWTRPVAINSQGALFLVGCRLTLGLPAIGPVPRSASSAGSV